MSTLLNLRAGEDWAGNPVGLVPRTMFRIYDDAAQVWKPVAPKMYDGTSWTQPTLPDSTWTRLSAFDPYIGEGSVLTRSVENMPVHSNSAAQAAWMQAHINYGGFGPTSLNTSVSGTHPIACYIVDSTMPNATFQSMAVSGSALLGNNHGTVAPNVGGNYARSVLTGMIPWPQWLTPAYAVQAGQDSATAIFDVGTGILREYYLVTSTGTNTWSSTQAGFSIVPRGLEGWTDLNYPLQFMYGFDAAVWMHNHLGFIGISEARNQQINHAIAFTFSNCAPIDSVGEAIHPDGTRYQAAGPCWPAMSCDGTADPVSDDIPMEGQWATLPKDLDLTVYPPFLRMVIKAIQTYGMLGTDKNLFTHAFNAEPGFAEKEFFGVDPWSQKGDLYVQYQKLNNMENRGNISPFDMSLFPWDKTIWAPRNWGAPY